jgi:hypothetical protein
VRNELLTSGVPVMIAAVCLGVFAYLTAVRRERFLAFLTAAWSLLVVRLVLTAIVSVPWPHPAFGYAAVFLRMAFAATFLAAVESLRGRAVRAAPAAWFAFIYTVTEIVADRFLPDGATIPVNAVVMTVILLAAAWRLGTYAPLPIFERVLTAAGTAVYAIVSGALLPMSERLRVFQPMFLAAWTAQLCIGVGLLALFFRASYEKELRIEQRRTASLAEALEGFVPICMHCKSIQDANRNWVSLEQYVAERSSVQLSHGLCPACMRTHYPDVMR